MNGYQFVETKLAVYNTIKFAWTIQHFNVLIMKEVFTTITSKPGSEKTPEYEWTVQARIERCDYKKKKYIRCLQYRAKVTCPRSARRIGMIESRYTIRSDKRNMPDYTKKFINPCQVESYNTFIKASALKKLCSYKSSHKLTIIFEGIAYGDTIIQVLVPIMEVPEYRCRKKYEEILETGKFSDVTLIASGQTIRAHKAILAGESSVFAAMFEHDMKEKRESIVPIDDIDADVVREMLRYMYVGTTAKLTEMTVKLHAAADKYDLGRLKAMCEAEMCRNMSVTSVADILITADLRGAVQLREQALQYIKSHCTEFITTPGYQRIVQSHPTLINYLLTNGLAEE